VPLDLGERHEQRTARAEHDDPVGGSDGAGSIARIAKAGGGAPTVLASAQPNPVNMAIDAVSIYWVNTGLKADGSDGALMRLAK
jgi:hypothetical protein